MRTIFRNISGLTKYTELLINSYFNITRRTMIDMVPKAIMLNLVQYALYALLGLSLWFSDANWYA